MTSTLPDENEMAEAFVVVLARARKAVDAALEPWLAAKVARARGVSPEVGLVGAQVRDLAMRGGKRMRAALVAAAYEAFGGGHDLAPVVPAMMAMELLQAYLLIHDDWMDDDDVRRGGPTVHVTLRSRLGSTRAGDAAAILAGDLASAWAQELLLACEEAPERVLRAARAYARLQDDVVMGQTAELRADPAAWGSEPHDGPAPVETIHVLKTASYTVTGPVTIGALLAGASPDAASALERFGSPLGIAFQLRDDLLGTFGDAAATGKPVGNDLREGKRTALVAELERDTRHAQDLAAVLGRMDATGHAVARVVEAMETSGAKARVETRVRSLAAEARDALERLRLPPSAGLRALHGSVVALTERAT